MLAACARRAARLVIGPCMWSVHCTIQGHCTSERLLSYGARPRFDAPAAAANAKHALRLAWRRRHCALSLSGGGVAHALSAREGRSARRADRAMLYTRTLRQLEASLHRRTAVLRRISCGLQHQACAASRVAQAPLRSLSLGRRRITRACGARAPRCAVSRRAGRSMRYTRPLRQLESTLNRRTDVL